MNRRLFVSLLLSVCLAPVAWAAAPAASADAPLVPEPVRQAMQDRDYPAAIKAADEAIKAKDAAKDYLTYLKGRALYLKGDYEPAAALMDQMQKDYPKSDWLRHARFAKAMALSRQGDFRAAELLVRAEAEFLLSAERTQQLADIYLEFADTFFKPPKDEQKPDYQKALEFYQKSLEVGPKPEKRIEVELLVAQCKQKLGDQAGAIALYEAFIKDHAGHALEIEARYRLGECQLATGNPKLARRTWQDLLAKFDDPRAERVADAQYNLARTWQMPRPNSAEDLNLGTAALEAFIEKFPTHKLAAKAHLEIAISFMFRGRHDDAVKSLKRFLADDRFKDRDELADARNMLGRSYQLQKKFTEAIQTWQDFLAKHPAHKAWSGVQRQIVNTEFLMAAEKLDAKKYDEARKLFGEFLAKYPLDARGPDILLLIANSFWQEENYDEAITQWRRAVSKYPNTDQSSQAQFLIAQTLEEKLGKLEDALEEYRKVTWGASHSTAQQAIAKLTTKTMAVVTERVLRGDETPRLKLVTRNIESVTVRAFKVDLETYFRKMHLAQGVEGLDIALIDPDKTFEFKIPNYAKHQELESAIEVPLPADAKSGVMAVTVSSKTLEATTLVLQSDLDVIVKSSRDEVFVFAENMLTGKPWADVRLLVSNGQQVFAEEKTGKDGVFKKSYKELKDAGDVRVFAVTGGNVASNVVNLSGVGVARGLADKGYIYTDRPAYRAGDIVHIRGCLRHATDDQYKIEKGKKYTVEVFDSRSRPVRQQEVTLSEFGTFRLFFSLPITSPQGAYRVLVRDADAKQNYQGSFTVHEYQLEPVQVAVDLPRTVYYRGEEVEGTIRAAYYYGAPLAGVEVRYQLADDRTHTAKTDEKGEVKFKLPTREFSEAQVLPLVVALPERNLQTQVNVVLASRGFTIGVSTVRPVFVAGETFEIKVNTNDAEGKPTPQKLTVKVFEQTNVEGKVGERLVEEHALETAKDDGVGLKTVKLEKGGRYIVRAEGTDRFKNPVSGQGFVQISDDEDAVRLRILADKHTFKVGDTAKLVVHWREEPALALLTFQGAKVLDYKLIQLKKGPNELSLPMTAILAPNFELSVAVMAEQSLKKRGEGRGEKGEGEKADVKDDGKPKAKDSKPKINLKSEITNLKSFVRFHESTSPFTVERNLKVQIAVKKSGDDKAPVRPGDEVEVSITATDPQGKPVSAELSLTMVEQSLLDRFGWQVGAIQGFFQNDWRQSAVKTASSISFAYHPSTQAINSRLLAEAERLEIAKEEEESRRVALAGGPVPATPEPADPAAPPVVVQEEEAAIDATNQVAELMLENAEQSIELDADGVMVMTDGSVNMPMQAAQQLQGQLSLGSSTIRTTQTLGRSYNRTRSSGGKVAAQAGGQASMPSRGELTSTQTLGRAYNRARSSDNDAWYMQANPGNSLVINGATVNLSSDNTYSGGTNFNAGVLNAFVANDQRQILVLDNSGNMRNVDLNGRGPWSERRAEELAAELARSGAVLLSTLIPQETGYWNPSITTDKDGKASVKIVLPERSTAWKLLTKGITAETLAGEATEALTVKKELFGQLKAPLSFTDGDAAEILASVHNDVLDKGAIEVTLKTTIGGRTTTEKKTLDVTAKGVKELSFKAKLDRPEAAKDDKAADEAPEVIVAFEMIVEAAGKRDVVRSFVPLKPYGMPVFATASGAATTDTTALIEAPAKMTVERPSLQLIIGPTVEKTLLDIVLGPAPWCQLEAIRLTTGLESTTSDLMAALGLQKLIGASREGGRPEAQALDGRVRSSVSILISSQNDDGGWSWTGRGGASERYGAARVVWALSLARKAGYAVPDESYNKALNYLQTQIAATAESDYESKAILLHGLATAGRGDFALANRLYRNRPALSAGALAHLALALAEMDRKPTAEEILGVLAERNLDETASRRTSATGSLPWTHAPAELRALYCLGLQAANPKSAKVEELTKWLLANRTGHRWMPDKATGPAALALCQWYAESRFESQHYKLTVFVNDVEVKVLDIDDGAGTQVIDVPAKLLKKGAKQRINFQIAGRARYTYQAILGGFVLADKLAKTTDDWRVERTYQPAPLEVDGREIPRGFGVLTGSYTTFKNPLTQLPVGRRGIVDLEIYRNVPSNTPQEQLEYLVVVEPIPSGATVIEKSVRGAYERFEIGPGAITFYLGSRQHGGTIHYELYGYTPGKYRAGPTVVRNAHWPDQLAVAAAKKLDVLPLDAKSSDEYKLTPQEMFELGKLYFNKMEMKTAQKHLGDLLAKWNLNADVYKQTVQMLLDAHLDTGPAAQVVRYFEIIKEKWPSEEITFAKILKVGSAYHEMGEYERSYLIFRATVEGAFARESKVPGFLEAQGEFARSVDVMGRLLREYPPEGYAAAANYSLAQRVYAKAPEAAADANLRKHKINRVDMVRRAWTMLETFLTEYPDDPAADQAAFATANALLELKAYDEAIAAANRYAKRYPKSELVDSYWYIIGYCNFATGKHQAALEMCRKVVEAMRTEKLTGRQVESLNKDRAIYILGQVYHSLGKAADAIVEYRRVEEKFPDAKQAIEYFTRKAIELPEVSTKKPGEKMEVELKFRNVAACDAKVYRIDLMKFSLLKRNLGGITHINLSGIRPYHEATVQLGDGKDYRDRTHKLDLPLKEEGAYLLVCRGDDLHASGLVLVTPLVVDVQEEAASGRVRTTVKDQTDDKYLKEVHVKVIGSRNDDFVSGQTDLRGVFVSDGIRGRSTVIAQAEGSRYAFFRGISELGPPPAPEGKPAAAQPAARVNAPANAADAQLLEGLQEMNLKFQGKQVDQLQQMYKNEQKGVEAQKAY